MDCTRERAFARGREAIDRARASSASASTNACVFESRTCRVDRRVFNDASTHHVSRVFARARHTGDDGAEDLRNGARGGRRGG